MAVSKLAYLNTRQQLGSNGCGSKVVQTMHGSFEIQRIGIGIRIVPRRVHRLWLWIDLRLMWSCCVLGLSFG